MQKEVEGLGRKGTRNYREPRGREEDISVLWVLHAAEMGLNPNSATSLLCDLA